MSSDDTKPCPYCAESVKKEAKICRFCHMDFATGKPIGAPDVRPPPPSEVKARSGVADGVKLGCGMFIVLPLLILLAFVFGGALLGELGKSSDAGSTDSPSRKEIEARDALTAAHNKGWSWARNSNAKNASDCSQLSNIDEQFGCNAYVTGMAR